MLSWSKAKYILTPRFTLLSHLQESDAYLILDHVFEKEKPEVK